MEFIKQGAESKVYLKKQGGEKVLVKERLVKEYRHFDLDRVLTKRRIKSEVKALEKARSFNILVPKVISRNLKERTITMEFIEGPTLKDYLRNLDKNSSDFDDNIKLIASKMAQIVKTLHEGGVIHGDLTTSNFIVKNGDINNIAIIDFGLSLISKKAEDKAVDLYVLERCFISSHTNLTNLVTQIIKLYGLSNDDVINKLKEVRLRGRKKMAIG
ncbi:TP53 regulating kinase [Bonamia ostreae]|uniref:non-specific serine/threonine protein kinase n=1 Tax=Bonamia ostreae TaxID=126728 RepID=A0ABV2AIS4_9EUKA